MRTKTAAAAVLVCSLLALPVSAESACVKPGAEEFRYSWKLRGGLAWVAGIKFPTSGVGELRNVYDGPSRNVDTQLRITSTGGEGSYVYHSVIDLNNSRTLMTYHGYTWGGKSATERTLFDYVRRLARTREEKKGRVEDRVDALPNVELRDVLTGIHYLRQNADCIRSPFATEIYSDGKLYPVVFRPDGVEQISVKGEKVQTRSYTIVAAPHAEKKWPGGVKVWLSADKSHIPLRIEMQRNFATLRLDMHDSRVCLLN